MFGIKMPSGSYIGLEREELRKDALKEKRAARAAAEETWQSRYDLQKADAETVYLQRRKDELADKKELKEIDLNNALLKEITKKVLSGQPVDLGGITASGGTKKGDSPLSRDESYSVLYGLLGENEEITGALSKIEAIKDPTALSLLANMTKNVYNQFAEQGYDSPEILMEKTNELILPVLTNVILTAPDPSKAGAMIKRLTDAGVKLNNTVTNLIKNQVGTTGSMTVLNEPVVEPKLSAQEIGQWENFLPKIAKDRARTEQTRIAKAKGTLNTRLENASADERKIINNTIGWISQRDETINSALENSKGDNPDFYELFGLYGNAGILEIFANEPRMRGQSVSPMFRRTMDAQPIEVSSVAILKELMNLNIFKEGDVFMYPDPATGQMVTRAWNGD